MLIWNVSLDGYLGALISVVIIKAGVEMLASPINQLLGAQAPPDLIHQIKSDITAMEPVQGVFDIILHGYGPNLSIGSLHIGVPDTMTAHQIHGLTRSISEKMYSKYGIIMTVGIYSVATGDNKNTELQKRVIQTLTRQEHVVQVHGFYYDNDKNRASVDIVPDRSITDDDAFIRQLSEQLKAIVLDTPVSIFIDHNYCD